MLDFSSTVSSQIRFLLQTLRDTNDDSIFRELCQFTENGIEASILLLQTFFDHLGFYSTDLKNIELEPVLLSVFKYILGKLNFSTVFSQSLRIIDITVVFLEDLSKALQLSISEKIGIGLALSDAENSDTRVCGKNFCMAQVEDMCTNPVSMNSVQIQNIILFLQQSEGLSKHVDSFMQMLSLAQLKDATPFVLSPLLPDELRENNYLRNLNIFHECEEDDFDDILAEMEKQTNMGDIVKELGYGCTVNVSRCKEILSLFLPLSEFTLSKILSTVARTHYGLDDNMSTFLAFTSAFGCSTQSDLQCPTSWNIGILVDSIKQLAPGTNWIRVIENLDHEGFYFPNEEAFSFFMSLYRHACQDPFPLHAICGSVWKNTEGQLSFLRYAVSAQPEVFTFAHSVRPPSYIDAVHGNNLLVGHLNHAWSCLDLLDVLCQLAERGHASVVRQMLEYPLNNCPELLLLGMTNINTAYNLLQIEVFFTVFPTLFKKGTGIGLMPYLWHVNPNLVLRGIVDALNNDADSMPQILEVCQEQKILLSVLEMIPSPSGIRLAALASRKELIDLEKWLINNLNTYRDIFFQECLKFLREINAHGSQDLSNGTYHHSVPVLNLYIETCPAVLKVLKAHSGLLSSSQPFEDIERMHVPVLDSNTRLQNGGAADSTSDGYAEDIEAEANSYFHQMFSGQLTIDAMVQMLARFKESSLSREKSIFECMIANLFEEYKFFSKYPEKQLKIAAVLFGSVIKHQLVTHLTLGIALRGVLDSLRKPADSKMFVFGTLAVEQFVDRLIEWPQYCNHILQISHLRGTHPELIAFIERALAKISSDGSNNSTDSHHIASGNVELNGLTNAHPGKQPTSLLLHPRLEIDDRVQKGSATSNDLKLMSSNAGQASVIPLGNPSSISKLQNANSAPASLSPSVGFSHPSRGATSARFGSALNIETLVAAAERRETPIEAPALAVQDKISFIINNISAANLEVKAKEFAEILVEQYYPWFAQYMVMKRASIEPNFHDLYLKFLDKVTNKDLNKEILQASYENCKVLLRSDLIKSSSEERSLLKNLGSWLGKLTIGRNHVLRAREIDPKSLIIEAYEKGLMIAVIPFTSKVLEPCRSSLAYQPPNPWTMAILGLLAEIYLMPNLKMNLKFDIEVLFKNLGVDMKDTTPSSLLKDRVREVEGNPDFSNKDLGASQQQMVAEIKPGAMPPLNQVDLPLEVASPSNSSGRTHMLPQYAALMDDEKLAAIGLSDQLPTTHGMLPTTPSQPLFSVSQLSTPIPNIGTHVIINQKLIALGLHIHFQRAVPVAMDRAIKEIVFGIVQRSVSIATKTTKELVLKDYAVETDETRIYNAAHLMVASLAGSLAHVTCKEPLRSSISSQLKNLLQALGITSELLDQAVQLVTNDNLDLGCAVIEQAATDKAIQTIDGEIAQQLALRRKRREGVGSTYMDANLSSQGSMGAVPDTLRPKSGHMSLSKQRVYEDFVRLPWQNQSVQGPHALPAGLSASSSSASLTSALGSASAQLNPAYSSSEVNSRLEAVSGPLDVISKSTDRSPHLSASLVNIGEGDDVAQHGSENDHILASFPSTVSGPGLHPVESLNAPLPLPIAMDDHGSSISENSLNTKDALDKYQSIIQKLESVITNEAREAEIQDVLVEIPEVILRCISRDEAALAMAQKVFKRLFENASNTVHAGAYLAMLVSLCDVSKLVAKELTSWVIYSDEEHRFNKDITVGLIRKKLLNLAEYNVHMAKLIDGGRNKAATEFVISLLQTLVIEESQLISDLPNLVDALAKLVARPGSPESVRELIEMIRNPVGNGVALPSVSDQKEDKGTGSSEVFREGYKSAETVEADLPGFQDQVSMLFAEWCRICELPGPKDAVCTHYILQLHQNGLLRGDDTTDRLFRLFTEIAVGHCLSSEVSDSGPPQQVQSLFFLAIDIYAKLVFSILKYMPVEQGSSKLYLLSKILSVTVRSIQKDAEDRKTSFNPRPYFRLFINWLVDLGSLDPVTEGTNLQILAAFANAFHALQPLKVPAFSFAWLELVSHRSFMPKLLSGNSQKGWPYMQRLLVDLLQFLEPFLRNAELAIPVHFLYKGTLRVLLVLLHDFPEFLCDYHFTFCDVIPPSCIQMRNIILSAFPRNMRLPDPSTPNLKIDLLAEITLPPRILSDVDAVLKANQMKADVDEYLKTRQSGSLFFTELKQKLLLPPGEAVRAGTSYNVPLINSLVLYVGMQAIQQLQTRTPNTQSANTVALAVFLVGAALDIFQTLIVDLDTEGRYLFLNAVANQLRYPNNHTHYFSFILLHLFTESNQEVIQEQITRVLLERLIVNRPHPWGLLITFIELIKNPRYSFWSRSFIRCAPEIDKLFESVSRSCGGPKPSEESLGSSWMGEKQ